MIQPSLTRRPVEEHLGAADRHLIEAEERLRHVEETVLSQPARDERHCALAEELLETMRRSRELMLAHRRLAAELAGVGDLDPDGP